MLGGQNKCLFRCVIKVEIVAVVDGVRGMEGGRGKCGCRYNQGCENGV